MSDSGTRPSVRLDRMDELLAEVAELRRTEMRKCVPCDPDPSKTRAVAIYRSAVRLVGGNSVVAESERCTESAVRRRQENPNIHVHLAHVYDMPPAAIVLIAEDLILAAREKEWRRVG